MPANNGIRPNNSERLRLRKQLADPTQNHLVDGQKWHPTGPTSSQHDDLLSQHQDLGFQRRARSEQLDDNPKNYSAEIQHPAEDHPILRLTQLDQIYDRDSPDIRFWPIADIASCTAHVCFWGIKRTWLLHRKMSTYDPKRTFGLIDILKPVGRQFVTRCPVAKC
jgi:hypothetical protein